MDRLKTGLCGQEEMVVEERHLASAMGNVGAEVLSTHYVVLLMELASRNAVEDLVREDQMVVGTSIGIRHLAAVPRGFKVKAESRLVEIRGRSLTFDVAAYDSTERIAEGTNTLLIVSKEKFLEKVRRKL
jgi:predicted thioesterase